MQITPIDYRDKNAKPTPPPKELPKIPSLDQLRSLTEGGGESIVQQIIEQHKLPYKIENGKLVDALVGTELQLSKFITADAYCLGLKPLITKLAKCQDEILITGETGTGKEIVARAMIGDRKGNFIAINCAGLPAELIESELFGHERGAFTGAESSKQGLFAVARDGVLFLDEIGELPLQSQGKLLRALQEKKIRRVGANKEEDINCKFVCATHRDIKDMVKTGKFREDLYARISVFELHLPPLRDRACDVELIIQSLPDGQRFLDTFRQADHRISDIDLSLNVRSLQRIVRRFAVLGEIILR